MKVTVEGNSFSVKTGPNSVKMVWWRGRGESLPEKDFKFLVYKSDPEVAIWNLLAIYLAHGRPLSESR